MIESTSSLQAIALLIDQLNSEDNKKRLNSVRNLSTIATALGPQRTRNQLLLFLNGRLIDDTSVSLIDLIDDDDEILITLAESLQNMISYVGGPAYIMSLIQLLEHLCKVQESKVREKATDAIKSILSQCKIGDFQMPLFECVKRLYTSDWFTAKLPVCTLIPFIYAYCSPKVQQELLKQGQQMITYPLRQFTKLSEDSIPQVRKTVALYLKDFIALLPKLQKPPERQLLSIFQKLSKDEHDSVKILAMDNCLEFMKVLPSGKASAGLLPFIKAYAQNEAWRMRYLVADKIVEIGMGMGSQNVQTHLLSYYVKFLQDGESEVRTAAVSRLANFCKMIHPDEIVKKICCLLKPISTDSFQYVRCKLLRFMKQSQNLAALADNILFLCPLVGKFNTNEHIVGVFLNLLRDESPDVRLNLFKGLEEFNKIIGIQNLAQSLVPAINELATNKNWRTRLTIIQKFPVLAKQLGQAFFSQKFGPICLEWLNDQVFAIRDAAINNLKQLCQVVGPKWMQKNAIPKIISFQRDTNYLYRLTTLFAIQKLAEYLPLQSFQRVMVPAILIMANDKVPNVRMNVARTLQQCKKYVKDKDVQGRVAQVLVQLSKDTDFDVAYTAKKAL